MAEQNLYMLRADLDFKALIRRGRRQGLPLRDVDLGYLVHSAADATFGPGTLRPFSVTEHTRCARVLAYTQQDEGMLRSNAQAFADPSDHAAWDWEGLAVKRMPDHFEQGRQLGFCLRACPVVRSMGWDGRPAGREIDVFLSTCARVGRDVTVDRQAVYVRWLSAQLERSGVSLVRGAVDKFQLVRLLRRTQGTSRASHKLKRPSVTFQGVLEIQDEDGFSALLRRGVGRHRAFGFGMLLLSRP